MTTAAALRIPTPTHLVGISIGALLQERAVRGVRGTEEAAAHRVTVRTA
jgi:hypothetical protein